jgi:hypothetical protein
LCSRAPRTRTNPPALGFVSEGSFFMSVLDRSIALGNSPLCVPFRFPVFAFRSSPSSVSDQLAGKSEGHVLGSRLPAPVRPPPPPRAIPPTRPRSSLGRGLPLESVSGAFPARRRPYRRRTIRCPDWKDASMPGQAASKRASSAVVRQFPIRTQSNLPLSPCPPRSPGASGDVTVHEIE